MKKYETAMEDMFDMSLETLIANKIDEDGNPSGYPLLVYYFLKLEELYEVIELTQDNEDEFVCLEFSNGGRAFVKDSKKIVHHEIYPWRGEPYVVTASEEAITIAYHLRFLIEVTLTIDSLRELAVARLEKLLVGIKEHDECKIIEELGIKNYTQPLLNRTSELGEFYV